MHNSWLWLEIGISPITGPHSSLVVGSASSTISNHIVISRQRLRSWLDRVKKCLFWSVLFKNWFQLLLALHERTYRRWRINLSETVIRLRSVDEVAYSFVRLLKVLLLFLLDNPLKTIDQVFIIFVGFKYIKAWKQKFISFDDKIL